VGLTCWLVPPIPSEMFLRIHLLLRQPLLQLVQRLAPMTYLIFFALVHLRIRLALVLEARIPAFISRISLSIPHTSKAKTLTYRKQ
jgi:hypothetical protein